MFSSAQPFRNIFQPTTELSASAIQSSTKSFSNQWDTKDQKKKIETKISLLSESIKSSIISDSAYNTSIYQWRKDQTAPILKVIQIARTSEVDPLTGIALTHKTIKPEMIICNLTSYRQFSKQELLLIFKNMLDGHQAIFKKLRATSISLEKSVISKNGQVKVWVNQQFERNDISGEILRKQQEIGKRIFQTVAFLASNNKYKINDFIEYVEACVRKSAKWTFSSLKAMIKSYADCLRIKIPKIITFNNQNDKKIVVSSMMQTMENQKTPIFRPRLKSFEIGNNKNISSSINYHLQSKRRSLMTSKCSNPNQVSGNNILIKKNSTNKSIEQKQTAPSLRTLYSYPKHTNSISTLVNQKDPVIQSFQEKNKQNICNINDLNFGNQRRKIPSINHILSYKIGISPLPEIQGEQDSSSPSGRKFYKQEDQQFQISPQFNIKIQKNGQQSIKPSKDSSISTNQTSTSGIQFCFAKKFKQSHITINLEQNKQRKNKNQEFKTASRDRFKNVSIVTRTQQPKKVVGSCTNWSNQQNNHNISKFIQQIQYSKIFTPNQIDKQEQKKQIISRLEIYRQSVEGKKFRQQGFSQQEKITPFKNQRNLINNYLNNPLGLLSELRSQQQLQSHQNTDKNSSYSSQNSMKKVRMPIEQKILQLLNINKKLVMSTYIQSNSQKKLSKKTPDYQNEKRLKDIQQTLSQLVRANLLQEEVLSGNCWTKRLQNLLGIQQNDLKQSISFGAEQANALLRQIKLSRLGQWGRDIGKSVIPQ